MMQPKVSIIVPIYNVENFLDKLILSLVNQTYKNLEIILVDDGSPDNSGAICDKYAEQDARIRVVHKKNEGAGIARNVGIDLSTGEYLVFVDGDDWIELDCVAYMLQLIEETHSDMAMPIKTFTTRNRTQTEQDKIEVWSAEKAAYAIIFPIMPVGAWNKIYSSKMIKENSIYFPINWGGEGLCFAFTAAQYANHVGIGRRKVYNYRLNNSDSALTRSRLSIGVNVLKHIQMLKNNLHLNTRKLNNACDWHLWNNKFFVIKLIVATNSMNENRNLYLECKRYLQKNAFASFKNTDFLYMGFTKKNILKRMIMMIAQTLFPVLLSKYFLKQEAKKLNLDKYK